MRRLLLFGLLAALLVPATARATSITTRIIQDCADDSVLEGHYTAAQLRKAARQLPTDVAEYSDCTSVLARAASAATSRQSAPSPGGAPANGGSGAPPAPAGNVLPANTQDTHALAVAAHRPPPEIVSPGRPVGVALAADVGRNPFPSVLLVVLILLAAASVAMAAPAARRVLARRRRP